MRVDQESTGFRPSGRGRAASESRRLSGPAGDIMLAARLLFEQRGVGKTTVKDIAAEANVTRDLVESVLVWNESRVFGDTAGSLKACIATFRRALYDANGLRPMIAVLEELGIRDSFDVRAVRETVDCINEQIVVEYAAYHQVEIEFVYEMFCMVIFGLVGLVKINPDISDEALMKVVEQALHLDMEPLPPAPTCSP